MPAGGGDELQQVGTWKACRSAVAAGVRAPDVLTIEATHKPALRLLRCLLWWKFWESAFRQMPLPININYLLSSPPVEWERVEFKEGWNPLTTDVPSSQASAAAYCG